MDVIKKHRSHIGGKRNKARGWHKVPPPEIRAETRRLGEALEKARKAEDQKKKP